MQPMADMMDALGILRTGILSSRARRTRSVCVVALSRISTIGQGPFFGPE